MQLYLKVSSSSWSRVEEADKAQQSFSESVAYNATSANMRIFLIIDSVFYLAIDLPCSRTPTNHKKSNFTWENLNQVLRYLASEVGFDR